MELIDKYEIVTNLINKVDYNKLFLGFKKKNIALYDDNKVAYNGKYVEKTNDFFANTSIEYKGEYIGIWKIDSESDLEIIASKLIHETFHAYQIENNESRFADEINTIVNYKYNELNIALKQEENNLIAKLLNNFNHEDFNKFINIRKIRRKKFKLETEYELKIEQIEGTATFVVLQSLKEINYQKYLDKLLIMKNSILDMKNNFPIRINCYNTGALIMKVMKDNNLKINEKFNDKYYLSYYLDVDNDMDFIYQNIEMINNARILINKYNEASKEIINANAISSNLVLNGKYKIDGINVYDARYYNNYLITKYFLAFSNQKIKKVLNGSYIINIDANLRILNIYKITNKGELL